MTTRNYALDPSYVNPSAISITLCQQCCQHEVYKAVYNGYISSNPLMQLTMKAEELCPAIQGQLDKLTVGRCLAAPIGYKASLQFLATEDVA